MIGLNHFARLSAALEENGLDALLLTCEANRFYASGFHSSGTDGMALVTRKGNWYFTDSRYTEAAGRAVQGAELREVRHSRNYLKQLDEVIRQEGLKKIGFEDEYMSVADHRRYAEKLDAEFLPATELLWRLRAVKEPAEVERIEAAQRIAERALEDIFSELRPGVTEREIAARLRYLMLHYGAETMSFEPIVVSGPNGSMPHGVPGDKPLQNGEFVTMDFGCIKDGYCSDMTRTVAIGSVTEEMRRVYDTVLQAQLAGIAAAKGGASGKAVDGAARAVIDAAGYGKFFGHSFGHGVGIEIHEAPYAASTNEKPMPAGAVISAEPGIYLPGRMGVRIEDMLLLTETGCRNLTKAPKELLIL